MAIFKTIEEEIDSYITGKVDLSDGNKFSQYKLVKRIALYQNQVYPKGKLDSQGNYKYWYDITAPRIDTEIKNIDFDTKNVQFYSESLTDSFAIFLANLELKKWLDKTKQANEINDSIEEFSSWGNVVWKKIEKEFERVDLKNFFVLNQTAKTLEDSTVIERHIMTQSDLRKKADTWKDIDTVIKTCGNKQFLVTEKANPNRTSNKFYEVYERNGEISEEELFEAQGKEKGDPDKFVLAKVITIGLTKNNKDDKYVLFAEEIDEMPYKEAHRGRYKGRWFREGLTEILFDPQTRANEIGNQLARGLEWASKTLFRSSDVLIIQNAMTDLRSGDILKTKDLQQVEVRMQGLDQLIADWNRIIELANSLANSYEVTTGETMPSGTSFRLGALINQNANKLFDFLREKLAVALEELIQSWIVSQLIKKLTAKEILDLTGSSDDLKQYYQIKANAWYVKNLLVFPPHSPDVATMVKQVKAQEYEKNKDNSLTNEKEFWDNFKPRIRVVISGENVNLASDLETISTFIQFEQDPIRRTALVEMAMQKKGINITSLPKTPPAPPMPTMREATQQIREPMKGQPKEAVKTE